MFEFGTLFKHETHDDRLEYLKGMPVNDTDNLAELIAILMSNIVNEDGLLVAPKLDPKGMTHVSYCWQIAYQLEKLGIVKYV